jgi:hypothetical protein
MYASLCVTRATHHVAPTIFLGQGRAWAMAPDWPASGRRIVFLALCMLRLSRARIRKFFLELFDQRHGCWGNDGESVVERAA